MDERKELVDRGKTSVSFNWSTFVLSFRVDDHLCLAVVLENVLANLREKAKELDQDRCSPS